MKFKSLIVTSVLAVALFGAASPPTNAHPANGVVCPEDDSPLQGHSWHMHRQGVSTTVCSGEYKAIDVFAMDGSTCIILETRQAECFGHRTYDYVEVRPDFDYVMPEVKKIAGAGYTVCFLLFNNSIECKGQTDEPYQQSYYGGDVVDFAFGTRSRCILVESGTVTCKFREDSTVTQPRQYLPGEALQLSGTTGYCVLLISGNVDCWGAYWGNDDGYWGGDAVKMARSTGGELHSHAYDLNCVLIQSGEPRCWGWGPHGDIGELPVGEMLDIGVSQSTACALLRNGNVQCAGWNRYGMNEGYSGGDAVKLSSGIYNSCVVTSEGAVHCWGDASYGKKIKYFPHDLL